MKEPMSIPSFLYDHFDHVVDWLTSSKAFKGLKAIYNNVIGRGMRNANQHVFNPNEINAFFRNFKWYHRNDLEAPIPDDFEADLNLPCKAEEEEEVSSGTCQCFPGKCLSPLPSLVITTNTGSIQLLCK